MSGAEPTGAGARPRRHHPPGRRASAAADLAVVVVFVVIGRLNHHHGLGLAGLCSTAWPFVVGLAVGELALWRWRRPAGSLSGGAVVCALTVAVGMALRVLAGQGTAAAFVVVALGFLGGAMLGWRALAAAGRGDRPGPARFLTSRVSRPTR